MGAGHVCPDGREGVQAGGALQLVAHRLGGRAVSLLPFQHVSQDREPVRPMVSQPPPGATFAAWNAAAPVATGTAADGIHHPEGDLKKFSEGSVQGYDSYSDGSSFVAMQWTQGVTEPASVAPGCRQ